MILWMHTILAMLLAGITPLISRIGSWQKLSLLMDSRKESVTSVVVISTTKPIRRKAKTNFKEDFQ